MLTIGVLFSYGICEVCEKGLCVLGEKLSVPHVHGVLNLWVCFCVHVYVVSVCVGLHVQVYLSAIHVCWRVTLPENESVHIQEGVCILCVPAYVVCP